MEDIDVSSLEVAKSSFLSLLSRVDPCESAGFVEWVIQQCSDVNTTESTGEKASYASMTSAEKKLKKIIKEIKKRVPLQGIMASENISHPEERENSEFHPSTTVHVDSFLYDDEDIDRLCDEGKMSRNYCKDCGSHNTAPLTFISHSSSLVQLRFIFQMALPMILNCLSNKLMLDVGSRLGAVLYGAYHFSTIQKIIGVEINLDLCNLQQEIIEKYNMSDRVEVRCSDICSELSLLEQADVVVLNNVFEFFLPVDEQIRTWKILRKHLTKPGCVLVTVPSLEEVTIFNNKACIDLNSWVKPCTVSYNVTETSSCDDDIYELQHIFFYQVK